MLAQDRAHSARCLVWSKSECRETEVDLRKAGPGLLKVVSRGRSLPKRIIPSGTKMTIQGLRDSAAS